MASRMEETMKREETGTVMIMAAAAAIPANQEKIAAGVVPADPAKAAAAVISSVPVIADVTADNRSQLIDNSSL